MKASPKLHSNKTLFNGRLCAIFFVLMLSMVGLSTMLGLQMLYSIQVLQLTDSQASLLFATSIALMFTMPVLGSYLAIHWLNSVSTIAIGLLLSAIGLYLICITSTHYFYLGLASFIIGNGCVLANLVGMLSRIYPKSDQRRDRAFIICFTGMNVGSFIALACLTLVAINWGYHFAFLTCAYLMVVALFIFISSANKLQVFTKSNNQKRVTSFRFINTFLCLLATIYGISVMLTHSKDHSYTLAIVAAVALTFIALALRDLAHISKKTLLVAIFLLSIATAFWAFFLLAPSLVTLYIERTQHHAFFNYAFPSTAFFALNPLFVILVGLAYGFVLRKRRHKNHHHTYWSALPFLCGLGCLSLAFLILSIVYYTPLHCLIQIISFYFMLSIAELLIFPLGASVMSRLLPQGREGLLTGIWLLSISIGSLISGFIARMVLNTTDTNLPHAVGTNYPLHFLHFSLIIAAIACLLTLAYHVGQRNTLTTQTSSASSSSSS
ncbi:MAG: oligopeptide:H+ symporter [Coxiellaceae bacterium]|nr:oligopeptide:H+ symporter [Coxiellaceae bacterium]